MAPSINKKKIMCSVVSALCEYGAKTDRRINVKEATQQYSLNYATAMSKTSLTGKLHFLEFTPKVVTYCVSSFFVILGNGGTVFPYPCSSGLQCCYPFVSVLVTLQFNFP